MHGGSWRDDLIQALIYFALAAAAPFIVILYAIFFAHVLGILLGR